MRACELEDCERKHKARGLCKMHYEKLQKSPDFRLLPNREKSKCRIKGCLNPYEGKGYCVKHYKRWKKHGDPLYRKGEKHGLRETKEYKIWLGMKARCRPGKHIKNYQKYYLRGIKVCKGWDEAYLLFLEDMGKRPEGKSIDRIDNDGHYSCGHCEQCLENGWPMNCRWATASEQNHNRRAIKNSTGLAGVSKRNKKYEATITINNKRISLGRFKSKEEAHLVYIKKKQSVLLEGRGC